MGFFKDTQHFEERSRQFFNNAKSYPIENNTSINSILTGGNDVKKSLQDEKLQQQRRSSTPISIASLPLKDNNSKNNLFDHIKNLFFRPSALQKSWSTSTDSIDYISPSMQSQTASRQPSSGYGSMDTSCDLETTYIKVSKFSEGDDESEMGVFGSFKEYKEQQQQQELGNDIKRVIESHAEKHIRVTDHLTLRMAADVMNLSKNEPYGLKGCKLIVVIQDGGSEEVKLGSIYPEKGLICTFEITLVIHIKPNVCRRFFITCTQKKMDVLSQYELRIEKLYTNNKSRRSSPTYRR